MTPDDAATLAAACNEVGFTMLACLAICIASMLILPLIVRR